LYRASDSIDRLVVRFVIWVRPYVEYPEVNNYIVAGEKTPTVQPQQWIGRVDAGARFFCGKMDEVRIWTTARTATEIRDNMAKTLAGNEAGLVAYYRFDQESTADQNTLYDLTANGNNGTLANMDPTTDWVTSTAFNTWIGSEGSDWATAVNWSGSAAPALTDNVGIMDYTGGNAPTVTAAANAGNLVIATGAELTVAGTNTLNVSGHWINNGDFTANTSTVNLTGTDQSLFGDTTFYNLTKNVTTAATLTFENGEANRTTITNTLDLQGADGQQLSLRSDTAGSQWEIDPRGTRTIAYVDVQDSKNVNATDIYAAGANSIDFGNNTKWAFADSPAIVTTQAVSFINSTSATGNGAITDLGIPDPTAHGMCWNTTGMPTLADNYTDDGAASATGAFTTSMTGLSANTTYYVRAYATNSETAYGTDVTFTTVSPGNWLDNFTNGTFLNWETTDTGTNSTVEETNDRLELSTQSTGGEAHVSVFVNDTDVADAIITARVLEIISGDEYNAFLMLRYNASGADSGYLFGVTDTGTVYIAKRIVGVTTTLAEEAVAVNLGDMDCRLKFAVIGNKIFGKVWNHLDTEPCQWMIEASDADFSSGDPGAGVSVPDTGTATAAFDDVSVTTDISNFYTNLGACGGSTIPAEGSGDADAGQSSVSIISNALQSHAASITEISGTPENPERGLFSGSLIDKTLDISCSLNNGDFTAVVKLHYTDVEVLGINEIDLRLYYYDEASESWPLAVDGNITGSVSFKGESAATATLGDYGVDLANNIVWAVVNHFTVFGSGGSGTGAWVLQNTSLAASTYLMLHRNSGQSPTQVNSGIGATDVWVSGAAAVVANTFSAPFGGQLMFSSVTTGGNFTVDVGSYSGGAFIPGISGTVNMVAGMTLYDMDALGTFGPGSFIVNAGDYLGMRITNSTTGVAQTLLTGGLRSWLNATSSSSTFPTLITLSHFRAETTDTGVRLTWQTESEVENTGFHIWRSTEEDGDYIRLTDALIPATGSETVAAAYEYEDETAEAGTRYYYKLEDIDANGDSVMHGPVTTPTNHHHDDTCFINTLLGR